MIDVLAKGLGKHVDEATVKCWYFEEGDHVTKGDDLVELATDDTVVTIPVPATGILTEVYFGEGDTVQRDDLLCVVDDKADDLDEDEGDDEKDDDKEDDKKKDDDEEDDF